MNDDAELDDLIKREIESRTWFILCQSRNSRVSRWVQAEVDMIEGLDDKVYEVIELDRDLESQIDRATALSKRATVFISYAGADADIATALRSALLDRDYRVFFDQADLVSGAPWAGQISAAIDSAVERGFFLLLLSPAALESDFVRDECEHMLQRHADAVRTANIVPVVVREPEAVRDVLPPGPLTELHAFDLTAGELSRRIKS